MAISAFTTKIAIVSLILSAFGLLLLNNALRRVTDKKVSEIHEIILRKYKDSNNNNQFLLEVTHNITGLDINDDVINNKSVFDRRSIENNDVLYVLVREIEKMLGVSKNGIKDVEEFNITITYTTNEDENFDHKLSISIHSVLLDLKGLKIKEDKIEHFKNMILNDLNLDLKIK